MTGPAPCQPEVDVPGPAWPAQPRWSRAPVRCVVAAAPLPEARPERTLLVALIAFTFDRLACDRPLTPARAPASAAPPLRSLWVCVGGWPPLCKPQPSERLSVPASARHPRPRGWCLPGWAGGDVGRLGPSSDGNFSPSAAPHPVCSYVVTLTGSDRTPESRCHREKYRPVCVRTSLLAVEGLAQASALPGPPAPALQPCRQLASPPQVRSRTALPAGGERPGTLADETRRRRYKTKRFYLVHWSLSLETPMENHPTGMGTGNW